MISGTHQNTENAVEQDVLPDFEQPAGVADSAGIQADADPTAAVAQADHFSYGLEQLADICKTAF